MGLEQRGASSAPVPQVLLQSLMAEDQLPHSRLPPDPALCQAHCAWLSSPPHPRSDATSLRQWDAAVWVCPPVENSVLPTVAPEEHWAAIVGRPPSLA